MTLDEQFDVFWQQAEKQLAEGNIVTTAMIKALAKDAYIAGSQQTP